MYLDPITRTLFRDAAVARGREARGPVVLMYHGTTPGRSRPSSVYSISAARLAVQLDLLRASGWRTACVRDLAHPQRLGPGTVILTFDDGLRDNFDGAFRPLIERGMCATWYAVSGRIGGSASWLRAREDERALLAKPELREMAAAGMEIGSHTRTHADLTRLDPAALRSEVRDSRRELEDLLGQEVSSFAYPYGRLDAAAAGEVREAGYRLACSTRPGWSSSDPDPFRIRRVTIFRDDGLGTFARKLAFAANQASWPDLLRYAGRRLQARLRGAA